MEIIYDDYTAFVQPDDSTPIKHEVPVLSKTASKRTVAKYLKRKCTISKLIARDQIDNIKPEPKEVCENNYSKVNLEIPKIPNYQISYYNETYNNHDITPLIFQPNFIANSNLIQDSKENNNSISEMLKCVLESNKGFIDVMEKTNEFPNSWLANGIPFDYCQAALTGAGLSASIDKQEREIAYNLLLRRLIDEALDRNVIFSHQPKELLNLINNILVRQFPEYEDAKHRGKVRSYLKACRRNSKKNNGRILMKNTAAYLSSGPGNRLMHQIYNSEKETIDLIRKESEKFRLAQNGKISQSQIQTPTVSSTASNQRQQQVLNVPNTLPALLPVSMQPVQSIVKSSSQIITSKPPIPMTQMPLLLPLTNNNNNNSNNINYSEPIKKSTKDHDQNYSEDVMKNISEIVRNLVNTDSNFSVPELIAQLYSTSSFLERFAKSLEKIQNSNK